VTRVTASSGQSNSADKDLIINSLINTVNKHKSLLDQLSAPLPQPAPAQPVQPNSGQLIVSNPPIPNPNQYNERELTEEEELLASLMTDPVFLYYWQSDLKVPLKIRDDLLTKHRKLLARKKRNELSETEILSREFIYPPDSLEIYYA